VHAGRAVHAGFCLNVVSSCHIRKRNATWSLGSTHDRTRNRQPCTQPLHRPSRNLIILRYWSATTPTHAPGAKDNRCTKSNIARLQRTGNRVHGVLNFDDDDVVIIGYFWNKIRAVAAKPRDASAVNFDPYVSSTIDMQYSGSMLCYSNSWSTPAHSSASRVFRQCGP